MTLIIKTPQELISWRKANSTKSIGFVPTMGALHKGHEKLLQTARTQNDLVVLSIFVNPTQFNNPEDLKNYPKTWDADLKMAQDNKVDVVFYPEYLSMYPDNFKFKVSENDFSFKLCGAHRPGHFDGVLTVVLKLFQIVSPNKAYFGEKDFQQLSLIKKMIDAFFLDIELVPVATVREADGLAMSSRNVRLSSQEREKAPLIYKIIKNEKSARAAREELTKLGFNVDYVEDIESRRYVAATLGNVRLIDNVEI